MATRRAYGRAAPFSRRSGPRGSLDVDDTDLSGGRPVKRSTKIIAGTAVAAAVAGGAGVAAAAGGSDDPVEGPDSAISGDALEKAGAAALAETGGGQVTGTEFEDEESLYEVEVTLDDGGQATSSSTSPSP